MNVTESSHPVFRYLVPFLLGNPLCILLGEKAIDDDDVVVRANSVFLHLHKIEVRDVLQVGIRYAHTGPATQASAGSGDDRQPTYTEFRHGCTSERCSRKG